MKRIRQFIRNWLGFSRTETNGFLIFLPLLLLMVLSLPVYKNMVRSKPEIRANEKVLDSLVALMNTGTRDTLEVLKRENYFTFNPNTTSENDLLKLGFTKQLTSRIAAYRSKGGVFRVKEDLRKIYGMDSSLYTQLQSFIALPDHKNNVVKAEVKSVSNKSNNRSAMFDLNKADTIALKSIVGIGSTLSKRIIKYREALGGFVNEDQLNEVYGLDSTVVQRLKDVCFIEKLFKPEQIHLNKAEEKEMAAHPYIKKALAKAIVSYRYQHGDFHSVNDLNKIALITPQQLNKVFPYLKTDDE